MEKIYPPNEECIASYDIKRFMNAVKLYGEDNPKQWLDNVIEALRFYEKLDEVSEMIEKYNASTTSSSSDIDQFSDEQESSFIPGELSASDEENFTNQTN